MTDKSELNLAPGSRWDDEYVRNDEGTSVTATPNGTLEMWFLGRPKWICFAADALAVIRAAGLDPEFERLRKLEAENAELQSNVSILEGMVFREED